MEEADESEQWLFVIHQSGLAAGEELDWLHREGGELRAIFSTAPRTARRNQQKPAH